MYTALKTTEMGVIELKLIFKKNYRQLTKNRSDTCIITRITRNMQGDFL